MVMASPGVTLSKMSFDFGNFSGFVPGVFLPCFKSRLLFSQGFPLIRGWWDWVGFPLLAFFNGIEVETVPLVVCRVEPKQSGKNFLGFFKPFETPGA